MRSQAFPSHRLPIAAAMLAMALPLFTTGCGDSPSGSDGTGLNPPEAAIDLAQEWGGLTDENEAPDFADAGIAGLGAETPVAEPMSSDPRVQALDQHPDRNAIFLRVVWGNLAGNSPDSNEAGPALSWNGELATTSGALLVNNLLRFERNDHIVRPRTDPAVLPFVSTTRGGVDGLLVRLVFNPDDTDPADLFTFETPPLTISFPLGSLAELDTMIPVDGLGNGVSIAAVEDDRRADCPAGMVTGIWRSGLDNGGHFRAALTTPNGFRAGAMRGRFGTNPQGEQVFVGKMIGPNGHFLGFVKGRYTVDDSDMAGGWRGLWFGRDRMEPIGELRGGWASRDEMAAGFMHGRWHRFCPGEPPPAN